MQAVLIRTPGGASQLHIGDYEKPTPKANELLVRVKSAGVNRMDILQREGKYPIPKGVSPILGVEMAGIVEATGNSVKKFKVGDKVFGLMYGGAYAQYCVIDAQSAMYIPDHLNFQQAAAIPENWYTAWQALVLIAGLKQDQDVLIHAGASGVSTAAIQIARKFGARRIFTTASSNEKLEYCRQLGATHLINYKTEDFAEFIHDITDGHGVDIIIDYIGVDYWKANMDSLAVDGHMVVLAFMSGAEIPGMTLAPILRKRLNIHGSTLRSRPLDYQRQMTDAVEQHVLPALDSGEFQVKIDREFDWTSVAAAHKHMEDNKNQGKIILNIT